MKKRLIALTLVVIALFAVCFFLWRSGLLERVRSVEELHALIDSAQPWSALVFFLLQMTSVIIAPIPSNVTMMAGALALGFLCAYVLGITAIIAGSMIAFFIARIFGRDVVSRILSKSVFEKYLPRIEKKQDVFLLLAMLFPFFPDDALCFLAGLTSISAIRFFLIMVLARPWGLAFAALLGGGMIDLPAWGWALLACALVAVFVLAVRYNQVIEDALLRMFDRVQAWLEQRRGEGK